MLNFMFPMPEEVIFEMSLDEDLDELTYSDPDESNYEDHGGGSCLPVRSISTKPKAKVVTVKCPNCGTPGLKRIQTPEGPDLVYATGPLAEKLHACP